MAKHKPAPPPADEPAGAGDRWWTVTVSTPLADARLAVPAPTAADAVDRVVDDFRRGCTAGPMG